MAFGEILKQHRLERGWTKEYISERTHIMTSKLDALESESLKKLPPPPYVKGWIRLYCEQLEIDPEPFLEDYQTQISGTTGKSKTVTRPAVRELPARPIEPIHTGAKRTLPPKESEPIQPTVATVHKIVEPAEETFTSVPKPMEHIAPDVFTQPPAPEAKMELFPTAAPTPTPVADFFAPPPAPAPVAPAPTPAPMPEADLFAPPPAPVAPAPTPAPEAFTLSSDPMPAAAAPAPMPSAPATPTPSTAHPHRAIFSNDFEKQKRGRTIVQQRDRADELRGQEEPSRRIFSPQQPVSDPPNPVLRPILDIFKSIGGLFTGMVTRATRPKVKRMQGNEGRYATPRMFYQALLIFMILLGLTGLVFVFRYVFRLSDQAEPEYGLTPSTPTTHFEERPVATPPEPFFD